ncbi:MAG: hypothetical protein RL637_668 [Pseudomonadota bacterium]
MPNISKVLAIMQLDEQLKNRLVGVAVLTILAVIFLPMLFEEPVEKHPPVVSSLPIPIQNGDVAQNGQIQLQPNVVDQSVSMSSAPATEIIADNLAQVPTRQARVKTPTPTPPNSVIQSSLAAHINPPMSAKSTMNTTATGVKQWFIQVASLADEAKANLLRDKLQAQGFMVIVESVWLKGKGHLFRLKVGPEPDQQRAESMKITINQLNHVDSMLIAQ